jgi:glycosyltransferase involved in cell wall biosynthesis
VANHAALLLPNSVNEYNRLTAAYGISQDYRVIPNAVDAEVFKPVPDKEKDGHLVLCASRIEGRKNQLNLIRALNGSKFTLCIIGSHSPNHKKYYEQCRAEAQPNVQFRGRVELGQLASLYARAKVHVLPSWFETTGLSSLEAAAMGCNIVITDKGDTREYFGDDAFYCEPDNITSIKDAVEKAASAPINRALAEKIHNNYTWDKAAEQTKAAYEQVLKKIQ